MQLPLYCTLEWESAQKDDARLPAPPLGLLQPTDRQVALRLRRQTTYRPISYLNVGV